MSNIATQLQPNTIATGRKSKQTPRTHARNTTKTNHTNTRTLHEICLFSHYRRGPLSRFFCVSCNVCGVSVGLLEALTGSLWAALQAPQAPLAHPWVILGWRWMLKYNACNIKLIFWNSSPHSPDEAYRVPQPPLGTSLPLAPGVRMTWVRNKISQ